MLTRRECRIRVAKGGKHFPHQVFSKCTVCHRQFTWMLQPSHLYWTWTRENKTPMTKIHQILNYFLPWPDVAWQQIKYFMFFFVQINKSQGVFDYTINRSHMCIWRLYVWCSLDGLTFCKFSTCLMQLCWKNVLRLCITYSLNDLQRPG